MATYKNHEEVGRQEIQAAIAKAVELRALHAALVQGSSPAAAANLRFSASPVSRPPAASQLSSAAQDYPVFTPSYEDEAGVPSYHKSRTASENWEDYDLGGGGGSGNDVILSDYKKGLLTLVNAGDDQKSTAGSCTTNHITVLQTSPKSGRRASLGDFKIPVACSDDNASRISKNSNIVVPLTDSHASTHSQPRSKGTSLSRWLAKLKSKNKNKNDDKNWSPSRAEPEEVRELGPSSIESMRRELLEANENRDAALAEVADMRSSLGELKSKLGHLETYCEDLKNALKQQTKGRSKSTSFDLNSNSNPMPVSSEAMTEGFLQIVSEARLSVKQFCKTLLGQIEESSDTTLTDNINSILSPYKLAITSKLTKPILYHLEAIINNSLYQDFENSAFCKNGAPRFLDPNQERQAQFASFVALRNLSWNEVLRKGTKYYSEEFSKFCDQKMSCVIATLSWTRPWPEQLLQAFFVAAKCVWLVHLLAFSFRPSLEILRVEEGRGFDGCYMEDVFGDRQRLGSGGSLGRVKVMVVPGFYVQERVLRCKVVCRYKSV